MHPHNKHISGYDFERLVLQTPELHQFIIERPTGKTIDFSNREAVRTLNTALLLTDYTIQNWEIPAQNLCPPIPGRADYIHHVADYVGTSSNITMIDIGTGASGIYALLAGRIYGWKTVATDISQDSLDNVAAILTSNPDLAAKIQLRLQPDPHAMLTNIIQTHEFYDLCVCNPPFYTSEKEALKENRTKNKNLGLNTQGRNFAGMNNELWCNGGEFLFLKKLVRESQKFTQECRWFTSLVSKSNTLAPIEKMLRKAKAQEIKVIPMKQGHKISRILLWTFTNHD